MRIVENMPWPPQIPFYLKMKEYSAWYSGEPAILAKFYSEDYRFAYGGYSSLRIEGKFWARQALNKGKIYKHLPLAGDIADTSASLLFFESPLITLVDNNIREQQKTLDRVLVGTNFFQKILEAAETAAAIGGVYIKLAWDRELSDYPIPVIVQADQAIPEFSFGVLRSVVFWKTLGIEGDTNKIYRLLETYSKDGIKTELFLGTSDKLGNKVDLLRLEETKDLTEYVSTYNELLAVYIPNMLPNKLDRSSPMGRSDYAGLETIFDSIDETYSAWMKDIALAQAKILIPEQYLKNENGDTEEFDLDAMLYKKLDIDPTVEGQHITPQQFAIRAEEFEKTTINLMERGISSAGYSPQSFGIGIEGRAESGTALLVRERKSFIKKGKKENYWLYGLQELVRKIMVVYKNEFSGRLDPFSEINVTFSDSITSDPNEVANSVRMLSEALSTSISTRVKILHPDWDEEQIIAEVEAIKEENGVGASFENPDFTGLFDKPKPEPDKE